MKAEENINLPWNDVAEGSLENEKQENRRTFGRIQIRAKTLSTVSIWMK